MHGPTLAEHGGPGGLPGRLSVTRLSGAALRALSKVVSAIGQYCHLQYHQL